MCVFAVFISPEWNEILLNSCGINAFLQKLMHQFWAFSTNLAIIELLMRYARVHIALKNRDTLWREYLDYLRISSQLIQPIYRLSTRKKTTKAIVSTKSGCFRFGTPVTAAITSVATRTRSHARILLSIELYLIDYFSIVEPFLASVYGWVLCSILWVKVKLLLYLNLAI